MSKLSKIVSCKSTSPIWLSDTLELVTVPGYQGLHVYEYTLDSTGHQVSYHDLAGDLFGCRYEWHTTFEWLYNYGYLPCPNAYIDVSPYTGKSPKQY